MTLEFVYWLTLGVGLAFLVFSLFLGDVLDVFDVELGGSEFAAGPVFFAAAAAFGAGGLLGLRAFDLGRGASALLGVGTGAAFGIATGILFAMLGRQEAEGALDLRGLIGTTGRCTVALGSGKVGRVSVTADGMTRAYAARSEEEIAVGEEVVVRGVLGSQMTVSRPAAPGDA